MYLAYLDDSGSDAESPIVVVGAALIADHLFPNIEGAAGTIVEHLIPPEKLDQFEEFHAAELYYGQKIFKDIDQDVRHKAIKAMLSFVTH